MNLLTPDSKLKTICHQIPLLTDATHITTLNGGLTNMNYRVDTPTGTYMMRISDKTSELLGINRENERINTEKAHKAGVAPAVMDFLVAENVLVMNWIEGKTLEIADFHTQLSMLSRVAESMKKLHGSSPFQGDFYFPAIRSQYLKLVLEKGYFIPESYLVVEPLVIELENRLAAHPEKKVSSHNDLVAGNFMDDGTKIWIIDYEYASQNEASYDIGNFAGEVGLSDEELTTFCTIYWREHLPPKIARAMAWSMITRFGWVLWASIQEAVSPIDFDFRAWGLEKWQTVLPDLMGERYHSVLENLKKYHNE